MSSHRQNPSWRELFNVKQGRPRPSGSLIRQMMLIGFLVLILFGLVFGSCLMLSNLRTGGDLPDEPRYQKDTLPQPGQSAPLR